MDFSVTPTQPKEKKMFYKFIPKDVLKVVLPVAIVVAEIAKVVLEQGKRIKKK